MNAIHTISTAPFFAKHKDGAYSMEKFDLYNAVLSALQWRRLNGEIKLVTDRAGAEYIRAIGLEGVWNGVREDIPGDLEGIDPRMFWAAGKLFALRETPAPAAMIDTDFIVWKKLSLNRLTAAHEENLNPSVYPPEEYFRFSKRPHISGLDWSALPLNTAFLYLPDEDFKQYYVAQSLAFMKSAATTDDYLCYMVFAEQRLLAMCAKSLGVEYGVLMDKDGLFFPQDDFTHLWGAKQALRDSPAENDEFLRRARERIRRDFPEYEYVYELIEKAR